MFSWFKRKAGAASEATFKTRVEQFWMWYAEVGERFYQTIEAGNCASLAEEVSAKVDEIIPGFAWVFGPGPNQQGHSFTLSGEGNIHRQLLTLHWLTQAPALPGWTFHAARQPGVIRGSSITIGGRKFDPLEFWITPELNPERKVVDITAWHPHFDTLPEKERYRILFLFLDELLGEYGTDQWIGEMKLSPTRLADSLPLEELSDFLKRVEEGQDWKKYPPGESRVLYTVKEQHERFLRDDILTGISCNPRLLIEYVRAFGELEDPLKGTGADYVFVAFDVQFLPKGEASVARAKIEDALHEALKSGASGRLIGGAFGRRNAYLDLMLFDGANSIAIVQQVLRDHGLPEGSSINYFAKEKRGHRVLI